PGRRRFPASPAFPFHKSALSVSFANIFRRGAHVRPGQLAYYIPGYRTGALSDRALADRRARQADRPTHRHHYRDHLAAALSRRILIGRERPARRTTHAGRSAIEDLERME